jgi:hypothetical protein
MAISCEDFASLLRSLPARSRVKVTFSHRAGTQIIDLLGAGAAGGTCYMEESGSWPRSFRYTEILAAEVVA